MPTTEQLPMLLRRSQVLATTGLEDAQFTKAVSAGVIPAVYLVWEVVSKRGKVLFSEMAEAKARAAAAKIPDAAARPCGRAYFRRDDVIKLAGGKV